LNTTKKRNEVLRIYWLKVGVRSKSGPFALRYSICLWGRQLESNSSLNPFKIDFCHLLYKVWFWSSVFHFPRRFNNWP